MTPMHDSIKYTNFKVLFKIQSNEEKKTETENHQTYLWHGVNTYAEHRRNKQINDAVCRWVFSM